jgi:hypothetical protein
LIKKTKHPTNKLERRKIAKKKAIHDNASPVYRLLKEKEEADVRAKDGELPPQ